MVFEKIRPQTKHSIVSVQQVYLRILQVYDSVQDLTDTEPYILRVDSLIKIGSSVIIVK